MKLATTLLDVFLIYPQRTLKSKDNKTFAQALYIKKIKSKSKVIYIEFKLVKSNYLDETLYH